MARFKTEGNVVKGNGVASSYRDILSSLAESLKPGGDIDKAMMSDIDIQGKQLQSQLSAGAIGRGLGNAQIGIPTQVFKNVSQTKAKVRSGLMEQYMSVLGNLAQLAFQEEQANANRAQSQVSQVPTGFSQAGSRLTDFNKLNLAGTPARQPTQDSLPSLYSAGGVGARDDYSTAPSLFGGAPVVSPGPYTGPYTGPAMGTLSFSSPGREGRSARDIEEMYTGLASFYGV